MSVKNLGILTTIVGAFGIVASLIVDLVGLGDDGIQSAQLLGIQVGILLVCIGLSLILAYPDRIIHWQESAHGLITRILAIPTSIWVLVGFLVVFILFFVYPAFFNDDLRMHYFNRYLPDRYPIGMDLQFTMDLVKTWVNTGDLPYPEEFYPPLTYVVLAPLALVDYPAVYRLMTFVTLISFFFFALVIPLHLSVKRDYGIVFLLFLSGILSYGFLFEVERGQFYVFTFLLSLVAIYLFHRHYELRHLSYLLFSISIQLKVIPVFYIFLFIRDWRDWKTNLKRFLGLGLLNIALLFVLGSDGFNGFVRATLSQLDSPGWSWNGNHSVKAFVFNLLKDGYHLMEPDTLTTLQQHGRSFEILLMSLIFLCIGAVIVRAYRLNEPGFNPNLLLVCTLGALTIPVSNDYTLPVLVAPLALFFSGLQPGLNIGKSFFSILLVLVTSTAYASLLFPFKYKPYFMNNSFPPLLIILISATLWYVFVYEGDFSKSTMGDKI